MKTILLSVIVLVAGTLQADVCALTELIQSYKRPVTVLGLSGLDEDQIEEVCTHFPASIFITKMTSSAQTSQTNRIIYLDDLTLDRSDAMSAHEHVDITYFFGSCFYKQKMIQSLLQLTDHLMIEMPVDLYDLLSDFLFKNHAQIVSHNEGHFLILLKRSEPKNFWPVWDKACKISIPLMVSYHYALIKNSKQAQPLAPGLSLYGYKLINGCYPSTEELTHLISTYSWKQQAACLPWNILLLGKKIQWQERFKEPKAWSKIGVESTIKGLKIKDIDKYKAYTLNQQKTIGI